MRSREPPLARPPRPLEILSAASPFPRQCKITHVDAEKMQLTLQPAEDGQIPEETDLQLRRITTYRTQPDYPDPSPISSNQQYLVYLDVWERHLSYLEDEGDLNMREVALGGPDTATRTKVVWQVKVIPTTESPSDLSSFMSLLQQQG